MDAKTALMIALLAAGLWSGVRQWELRPMHPQDGLLAPDDPLQTDVQKAEPLHHGRWTLTPRATYEITARILGREDYHFDALSDLIPEDLALGWGPMSDNRFLAGFEISQGGRFYEWRPRDSRPFVREDVSTHSANTHVIPVDSVVRRQLARLRVGEIVRLTGTLVDAVRDDGAYVRTSLTRTDTGAGACEVMLVERVESPPLE